MKDLIIKLVTTNSGWLLRGALKLVTTGSAAFAAYLTAKGVDAQLTTAITAGLVSGASWVLETALSFVARKYAVK